MVTARHCPWRRTEAVQLAQLPYTFSEDPPPESPHSRMGTDIYLHYFNFRYKWKARCEGEPTELLPEVLCPTPSSTLLKLNHWVFRLFDHPVHYCYPTWTTLFDNYIKSIPSCVVAIRERHPNNRLNSGTWVPLVPVWQNDSLSLRFLTLYLPHEKVEIALDKRDFLPTQKIFLVPL